MPDLLFLLMIGFGLSSLVFLILAFAAIGKRKFIGSAGVLMVAVLCLALTALLGTITVATKGYLALTHEETAAVVRVEPLGGKAFLAHFEFPDGKKASFQLAGDAIYVDAHVLKWKPWANVLGLHTVMNWIALPAATGTLTKKSTRCARCFYFPKKSRLTCFI